MNFIDLFHYKVVPFLNTHVSQEGIVMFDVRIKILCLIF